MISKKLKKDITGKLNSIYHPKEIYLFGSHVWGIPTKQSDLDLLLVVAKSQEKPYKRTFLGRKALRGLKMAKDLLVYTEKEFNELAIDKSSLCYKVKNYGEKWL